MLDIQRKSKDNNGPKDPLVYILSTLLLLFILGNSRPAWAQVPPAPHVPLIDGDDTRDPSGTYYKGQYHGHLYGHWNEGTDIEDSTHDIDGKNRATSVQSACAGSQCVVLAIGMSHWTKEICGDQPPNLQPPPGSNYCNPNGWSFIDKAFPNLQFNHHVTLVDCAEIGAVAWYWADATRYFPGVGTDLYTNCNAILTSLGLTPAQVQVVLFKEADSGDPNSPNLIPLIPLPNSGFAGCQGLTPQPDVCLLMGYVGQTARTIMTKYPNVQQMFVHSRIYGGYGNVTQPTPNNLNPEPFAYEQGFAMKWLIQSQIDEIHGFSPDPTVGTLNYNSQPPAAPWIDWGTYMWASGTTVPCQNCKIHNLTWRQDVLGPNALCSTGQECDFQALTGVPPNTKGDNLHPSLCGRDKVSNMLMYFYCNSDYTKGWFRSAPSVSCMPTAPTNTCAFGQ